MKEKEMELSLEEIRYLLNGTVQWQDILEKKKPIQRNAAHFRKPGDPQPKPHGLDVLNDQYNPNQNQQNENLRKQNLQNQKDQASGLPLQQMPDDRSRLYEILFRRSQSQTDEIQADPMDEELITGSRRPTGLEGKAVFLLLASVGMITFSTWAYFVLAG